MEVYINRQTINELYTEGCIFINGEKQTYTVESTEHMLPAGMYLVKLITKNAHKRELEIFTPEGRSVGWRIGIAHSWIGSRKERTIAIGQPFYPGAVYKATEIYERIIKRLEKCRARKEVINLIIDESHLVQNQPISHWTKPPCACSPKSVTRNA